MLLIVMLVASLILAVFLCIPVSMLAARTNVKDRS
jgi:ABC-type phosphate/phosphonate transport system permease subunit